MLRQRNKSKGQALVEFALIITVLLMLMFLVVESARILQGWVTVQNAARSGARYAITGANMTNCPMTASPKWTGKCSDLRVASIYTTTHRGLSGLPLDEDAASNAYRDINGNPPDPNSYDIQVYGGTVTDQGAQLLFDFGGMPGQPVVVRAVYNVPIITPFFRPIIASVPVFGQVTMNNENFGSLGNPTQGLGLPPDLEPVPTVGATPTPTPSPTSTPTNTPGATASPTLTPSNTPTATPDYCGAHFEKAPVDGENFAWVSGEPGATVTILDQTTGQTLGTDTFLLAPNPNRQCDGFADFNTAPFTTAFQAGHVVLAIPSQGQPDTAIVLQGTPTPTPSPTSSPPPPSTPTVSPTPSLTPTPVNPYIALIPNCSIGSSAQFQVLGFNWPNNEAVVLFWNGAPQSNIPAGHGGFFAQTWQKSNLTVGSPTNPNIYPVGAQSNSASATADFEVPCSNVTPTIVATSTSTPNPEDLIIVGQPQLVSTRPLVAYQPIEVSLVISNTGDIDVSNQFFVDVYFDPVGSISPTIGISQSVGYMGVSSLPGRTSRVITITAPLGFNNLPDPHLTYGMVDSLETIGESIEYNNVSAPLSVPDVTPAATPTPSPTPQTGSESISGIVWVRIGNWVPQNRATVTLINELNGQQINSTVTDRNGFFQFFAPPGTYTVRSCALIDNIQLAGLRTGITAPNSLADIYLLPGACP